MSSTRHLLLSSLRASLAPRAAFDSQGGDWRELAHLAAETSLSAQLLQAAGGVSAAAMPSECLKGLLEQVRHAAVRNALQQQRLKQLVEACATEGIPVMLVKGLWLVHRVYGDVAARDSGDIDLLFRQGDIPRLMQVARNLGYEVPQEDGSLAAAARSTNEFMLRRPEGGLLVDVHWSLTHPATEAPVDEELLWTRSKVVDIGGVSCRTLGLEDHLLYLCFHAAVHHMFRAIGPRCLYDVAMVIRQPPRPIRWQELGDRARALGWERAAWLMFALVEEHLGVQVPLKVMQDLHPGAPEDREVLRLALDAMFAAREQKSLHRHVARMLAPSFAGSRLAALRQLVLPSRAQLASQFGASTEAPTWLLHVRRWAILLRDWAPEAAGLLLGARTQREALARTRRIERWLGARA